MPLSKEDLRSLHYELVVSQGESPTLTLLGRDHDSRGAPEIARSDEAWAIVGLTTTIQEANAEILIFEDQFTAENFADAEKIAHEDRRYVLTKDLINPPQGSNRFWRVLIQRVPLRR